MLINRYTSFITVMIAVSVVIWTASCANEPNQNNVHLQEQGVFEFFGEATAFDDDKELPHYINPDDVLCFGKGLKVGRCISKQLETGICIGLIKHNKHVIATEIPCDTIKKDTIQQEIFTE